jgi:hypothetical protein
VSCIIIYDLRVRLDTLIGDNVVTKCAISYLQIWRDSERVAIHSLGSTMYTHVGPPSYPPVPGSFEMSGNRAPTFEIVRLLGGSDYRKFGIASAFPRPMSRGPTDLKSLNSRSFDIFGIDEVPVPTGGASTGRAVFVRGINPNFDTHQIPHPDRIIPPAEQGARHVAQPAPNLPIACNRTSL